VTRRVKSLRYRKGVVPCPFSRLATLVALALLLSGCSIKKYAINTVGDALAEGNSVYETDEDVALVGDALPFGLKLVESLLQESPDHRGLLLTATRGFVLYSYAYVDYPAEVAADEDIQKAREMRARARKLYERSFRYGLRGLETSYPALGSQLIADPTAALSVIRNQKKKQQDLPFLYWTAAALGSAISVSKNDAAMLGRIPEVEAMLDRALALDEGWEEGAFHEFQVTLATAKPGTPDEESVRMHFSRALELSGGKRAGLFVALARALSIPNQNRSEFTSLLNKALAVDPDEHINHRLANLLAQRQARRLLAKTDELFFEEAPASSVGGSP